VTIKPGKSLTQAYEIANNSESDLYLRARVVPFKAADNQGGIRLKESGLELPPYFSLQNANLKLGQIFKLAAGAKKQLVLKISIPKDAPEKDGYFTFLLEQPAGLELRRQNISRSLIKIGSNILLSISNQEITTKKGLISQFLAVPRIADMFSKVSFEVIADNTGSRYFKPEASIVIKRWPEKEVGKLLLRPDNVLAQSQRKLVCWQPPTKEIEAKTIPCQFSSAIPGRYQATLTFKPAESNQPVQTTTVTFWILPIRISLLIAALILFWLVATGLKRKRARPVSNTKY
jgi:hypothetical protein